MTAGATLAVIQGACLGKRVLQEKPNHLGRGVGSLRKGIGTGGAATRPSVASAMNDPLFHYRLAAGISMQYAAVREPTRDLAFFDPLPKRRALARLRNDCIGVAGVDRVSLSPWNTIAGTTRGFDPAGAVCPFLGAGPPLPFIAANAEGRSRAARQASPECTAIAAYRSG